MERGFLIRSLHKNSVFAFGRLGSENTVKGNADSQIGIKFVAGLAWPDCPGEMAIEMKGEEGRIATGMVHLTAELAH